MSVTCVVQARMGSTRLPGKVLADLGGHPLLAFMLERLRGGNTGEIVVATSTAPADDAVAEITRKLGVELVRGPEQDVLARFGVALERYPADICVRLTADCPLIDKSIVEAVIGRLEESGAEYASNTLMRTYPDGLDVEAMTASALRTAVAEATDPEEREHVTPFLYRHPERFPVAHLSTDDLLGDERWTVDTPDDLEFVRGVVDRFAPRIDFGWREILSAVGRRARPEPGQLHLRPALPRDSERVLAWRNDPASIRYSRSGSPVAAADHERWFADRLSGSGTLLWIGEVDDRPVGQVRIDVRSTIGLVSIAVAAEERGRGYGIGLLEGLQRTVVERLLVRELEAEVHPENEASLRIFERTGFGPDGEREAFKVFRWRR